MDNETGVPFYKAIIHLLTEEMMNAEGLNSFVPTWERDYC